MQMTNHSTLQTGIQKSDAPHYSGVAFAIAASQFNPFSVDVKEYRHEKIHLAIFFHPKKGSQLYFLATHLSKYIHSVSE